ncbi:MAG: YdcH family protein, partial [Betaproteobacteria bacterium]
PRRWQPMTAIALESVEEVKRRISELNLEHRDLDRAIEALEQNPLHDELQLKRLKKRKLMLKDQIFMLQRQLVPDIPA